MRLLSAVVGLSALFVVSCGSHHQDATANISKSEVQIYLVRHARAYRNEPNSTGMSSEKLDSLTPRGITQANEAADSLVKKHIVAVYASPTHRTMQTGEIIAKKVHAQGPIAMAAFGPMTENEPASSGLSRALDGVREVSRQHRGQAIVIVTHGDIAPLLIGEARHTPLENRMTEETIEPGKVVHLVWEDGRLRLAQ